MMSLPGQVVSPKITPEWRDFSVFEYLRHDLAIYLASMARFIAQLSEAHEILPRGRITRIYGAPG